jgi:hypothetical protein
MENLGLMLIFSSILALNFESSPKYKLLVKQIKSFSGGQQIN